MEEEKKENINEIINEVEEELMKEDEVEKPSENGENEASKIKETEEETKKEEESSEVKNIQTNNKSVSTYVLIAILVIFVIVLGILDYPKIAKLLKTPSNAYGFDYNFNKVRSFDWDTLITEKKIARALDVPLQKINSAKNPDYSWVLEEPQQFIDDVVCAALVDEKILNEINDNEKNLFNINITICKDTAETLKTFTDRENETKNVSSTDPSITVKKLEDTNDIGTSGYTYIIDKKGATDPTNPNAVGAASERFGGISFIRGPFIVMIDESEKIGMATLSSDEDRNKLADYIDKELKRILVWY